VRAEVEPGLRAALYLHSGHVKDNQHAASRASFGAYIRERLADVFGGGVGVCQAVHVLSGVAGGCIARESGVKDGGRQPEEQGV
jgi:hypothetical protein